MSSSISESGNNTSVTATGADSSGEDTLIIPRTAQGVRSLAEVTRSDTRAVGNKAALLGELHAAGLPVVPGIVVCTESCQGLRNTREFSAALQTDFVSLLDELFPEQHWFAIRSSLVEGARAAEQNLTDTRCEYFVPRDALTVAIIACAAAPAPELASDPAAPANVCGANGTLQRAVIVQPMVSAEVSGLVFAGELEKGAVSSYLVESCWGLGRALIDGQTDPDRYELDALGEVAEQQRGRKQHQIKFEGRGLLVGVDEAKRLDWTLTPSQLKALCSLTKRCAKTLGQVQDLEFALTPDGFVVLQSRPIDASKLMPEYVPPGTWALHATHDENATAPLTPLSEDMLKPFLPGFARFIYGRLYVDVAQISNHLPLRTDLSALASSLQNPLTLTALKISGPAALLAAPGWLARSALTLPFRLRHRSDLQQSNNSFSEYTNTLIQDNSLNAKQLLEQLLTPARKKWRSPIKLNAASHRALVYIGVLQRLLTRWTTRELEPGTLLQLYTSEGESQFSMMATELSSVSAEVAKHERLSSAFAQGVTGVSLHQLVSTPPAVQKAVQDAVQHNEKNSESSAERSDQFAPKFSAFVQRQGHRGGFDTEFATARWVEDPQSLLPLIGVQLKAQGIEGMTPLDRGYRAQLLARDDLHQALPRAWQRKICGYLLERIRFYLDLQLDARDMLAKSMLVVRRRLLALEDRLLREGKLLQVGDLFFLSWSDITYLDSGQLSTDDAATLVATGRDQYAARCGTSTAPLLGVPATSTSTHNKTTTINPDRVNGQCGSPGVVEGTARVVQSTAELTDFEPGEVLVLGFADPALAPAAAAAAAIVCERGHALSELALAARRFGRPMIVGAQSCTRTIATGERIRVNATDGNIEIIAPEDNPTA